MADGIRETVRDIGRALPLGGARAGLVCPKCHGGRSGERSFSVYRNEGGIGGRCHRASCGLNIYRSELIKGPTRGPVFKPRPYPYPLLSPGPASRAWMLLGVAPEDRTQALAARLGVFSMATNEDELVWEVRDYDWSVRGHISRTYPDKTIRSWKEREGPWTGYHGITRTRTVWVVEDMVSAAKITLAGGNAVALLGTVMSREAMGELGSYLRRVESLLGAPRVYVALDPDAAIKTIELARSLTARVGYDTIPLLLNADPKDLPGPELGELIRGSL